MMPYILHVAILTTICYLGYKWLFEKTSFYFLNRNLLLLCLILCFCLPFLKIPKDWSLQNYYTINSFYKTSSEMLSLPEYTQERENGEAIIAPSTLASESKQKNSKWWLYLYLVGFLFFLFNWIRQLSSLVYKIHRHPVLVEGRFRLVIHKNKTAPYSFLNFIFINPQQYDADTLAQIMAHEKIHISQGHSLDMILGELLIVFQWFNPFAYQYRKSIENNLEFLTDQSMLENGAERESYQMSLIKVAVPQTRFSFVSNYSQSMLRTRISRMNGKKSSLRAGRKYLILLFVLSFSVPLLNASKDKTELFVQKREPIDGINVSISDSIALSKKHELKQHQNDLRVQERLRETNELSHDIQTLDETSFVQLEPDTIGLSIISHINHEALSFELLTPYKLNKFNEDLIVPNHMLRSAKQKKKLAKSDKKGVKIIEQDRHLSGFSRLEIHGDFRVVMQKRDKDEVIVKGFEDKMHLLKTKLRNGTLKIWIEPGYKSGHRYDVLVTAKDIRSRLITGGAHYVSETFLIEEK